MSFLRDYIAYNQGNECPRNYHLWSALVVLAATMQKKVHIHQGYFDIHPNLYVCLVGNQGSRKSTAKDIARDLFTATFPNTPIGASVTSREDIIRFMSSPDGLRSFTNAKGEVEEIRPYVLFINELKNFLSFNASGMIDFLTDIYDRKYFDSSTLKRGLEDIPNPCVNILACETPKWIIDKLKQDVITGGFARRIVYVYETERPNRISYPKLPDGAAELYLRLQAHLQKIGLMAGQFKWTASASRFFDKWYQGLKAPDDEVMAGYYESKHIQLLKVAMLLALSEYEPHLCITEEFLQTSLALLDSIEVNMPKLSAAAGRNELAIPTLRVLEILKSNGDLMPEKFLRREINKDLTPMEQISVFRYLQETEQMFILPCDVNGVRRMMAMTKEKRDEIEKKQGVQGSASGTTETPKG